MIINSDLNKKISMLDSDKRDILFFLLEDIEDGKVQTQIEDRVRNEIREIIKEGEQS